MLNAKVSPCDITMYQSLKGCDILLVWYVLGVFYLGKTFPFCNHLLLFAVGSALYFGNKAS